MIKKRFAILMATVLTVCAIPFSSVGAEEADLPTFSEIVAESYDQMEEDAVIDLSSIYSKNSTVDCTLTLGEAGRNLIAMFLPVDISPLESVGFNVAAKIDDGNMQSRIDGMVNAKEILEVLFTLDTETLAYTLAVPALTDVVLGGNYADLAAAGDDATGEEMKSFLNGYFGALNSLMDSENGLQEDVDRFMNVYKDIAEVVMNYYVDDQSKESAYDLYDISEDCIAASAYINFADMMPMAKEILTLLQEDEDVAYLADKYGSSLGVSVNGEPVAIDGAMVQETIGQLIDSLDEEAQPEYDDDDYLYATLYQNADGKVIGADMNVFMDDESVTSFGYGAPSDGDHKGFSVYGSLNEETNFELTGDGYEEEGGFNGNYTFYYGDVAVVNIGAYDVVAEGQNLDGTFVLSPATPDEDAADPLGLKDMIGFLTGFDLSCEVHSQAQSGNAVLTVNSADEPLVTMDMNWDGETEVEGIEAPEDVLDIADGSEESINTLMESLHPDTIISNLEEAGLSMEFIGNLMSIFSGEAPAPAAE